MTDDRRIARKALTKARGLLARIERMIDDDAYCIDIMQQNLAAIGLLKSVHHSLLQGHLRSCVSDALKSGKATKQQRLIDEVLVVSKLASR